MVNTIKNRITDRRNILMFLIGGSTISLALYFSLFGHAVYGVVERQAAERAISVTESNVEVLEASYFDLKGRVNMELAQKKGFTEISSATYISRKALGKGLTLNNEI